MRTLIFLLTLLVIGACTAHAQSEPCVNPLASASTYIGSYTVTQVIPNPPPAKGKKPKKRGGRHGRKGHLGGEGNAIVNVTVCVWRNEKGEFHLFQDLNSLAVTDSSMLVDTMSTPTLVAVTARSAIAQGIQLGFITCTGSCGTPNTAVVWQSQCVMRSGSGSSTHLTPCPGSGNCSRNYTFCCPTTPTMPSIVQVPSPLPAPCTGACQSTCM